MILVGDIGGTKTSLALFADARPGAPLVANARLASRDFPSLEAALRSFLEAQGRPRIDAACFGVAGAVVDGHCVATNLPWEMDERQLSREIPSPRVRLLNDLEAAGYGVMGLRPDELAEIQPGRARAGHKVLIAAGTGLGEALLLWHQGHYHVNASEGGHADFAPRSETEVGLLEYLRRAHGRVSYERVLSGPGLVNIYRFFRDTGGAPEPAWLRDRLAAEDPAAVISEAAMAGDDPACVAALGLLASIYGAEAGNLALKALAMGGVIVGGGIAPKIRGKLQDGAFVRAFRDKAPLDGLMTEIPVHVVLNAETPLLGAAAIARRLLAEPG